MKTNMGYVVRQMHIQTGVVTRRKYGLKQRNSYIFVFVLKSMDTVVCFN
jgi:hypothetical protein